MSEEIDYAARVQRGIALMDEKWPDWATGIDLETLDIRSGSCCVTAQYAEHFTGDPDSTWQDGMDLLDLSFNSYREHGFNGDEDETGAVPNEAYEHLNGLWRSEIERRRAQGQDAPAEPEASGR